MPELPGGTLTVLHTDVESSTPLAVHLGDRYPEVLSGGSKRSREAGPRYPLSGQMVSPTARFSACTPLPCGERFGFGPAIFGL